MECRVIALTPSYLRAINGTWHDLWNQLRRASQSRTIRSIREFAEQCVTIPDGPYKGFRFDCNRQPWTALFFDLIDHGIWPEIIGTSPSQGGKTLVMFVIPLLWAACELRENTGVALPDEEMWGDKWAIDILPVIEASPELRHLKPNRGTGSAGGKPKEAVTLANNVELKPFTPSGGEHTRSGYTARVIVVTELYRFDGDPFGELQARQGAYNRFDEHGNLTTNRRFFGEGTLTSKRELPWTLRNTDDPEAPPISTESEIYSPCPRCMEYSLFDREHLAGWEVATNELEAAVNAAWECPKCSHRFCEVDRRWSASHCRLVHRGQTVDFLGNVEGPIPLVARLFFRVNAFQNLLVTTAELAAEEWQAKQLDPESPVGIDKAKYLATKKFAQPYETPMLDFVPLRASWIRDNRRGRWPLNVLPDDTIYYSVGIDLGKFTCWYVGLSFRETGEIAIVNFAGVDTSLIRKSESQGVQVYEAVSATLNRIYDELDEGLPCNGVPMQPQIRMVDSGWFPDVAFDLCLKRGGLPILGRGKSQFKGREYLAPNRVGGSDKNASRVFEVGDGYHVSYVRERGYYQLTLDADKSKLDVQSGLRVEPGKPGSISLPREIDQRHLTKLCGHLAAEVRRQTRDERGRLVEEWVQTRGRHDLLDAAGYAFVGGRYLGYGQTAEQPESNNQPKPQPIAPMFRTFDDRPFLITERQ